MSLERRAVCITQAHAHTRTHSFTQHTVTPYPPLHKSHTQELKEVSEERGLPRPAYSSRSTLSQLLADVRGEAALEEELQEAATDAQVGACLPCKQSVCAFDASASL